MTTRPKAIRRGDQMWSLQHKPPREKTPEEKAAMEAARRKAERRMREDNATHHMRQLNVADLPPESQVELYNKLVEVLAAR